MTNVKTESVSTHIESFKINNALPLPAEDEDEGDPETLTSQHSASTSQVEKEEIATILDGTFF